jgi:hypothetical protein
LDVASAEAEAEEPGMSRGLEWDAIEDVRNLLDGIDMMVVYPSKASAVRSLATRSLQQKSSTVSDTRCNRDAENDD